MFEMLVRYPFGLCRPNNVDVDVDVDVNLLTGKGYFKPLDA